jgi:hypothetical protein
MEHFSDCPEGRGYNICTCEMLGEEIAIVDWQIEKQEGKIKWWQWIKRLTISGSPDIPIKS